MILLSLFRVIDSVMLCVTTCCLGAVRLVWSQYGRGGRKERLAFQPTEINLKKPLVPSTNAYTSFQLAGSHGIPHSLRH